MDKLLKDKRVLFDRVPEDYKTLYTSYQAVTKDYEVVFTFAHRLEDMQAILNTYTNLLSPGNLLYIAYPKLKNAKGIEGIHRDHLFPFLRVDEKTGYVNQTLMRFNKMVSLDDNYTLIGIKKDDTHQKRKGASQRQEDYANHVEDVMDLLKEEPCLAFYQSLTPGYQKSYARYIFSAKQEATKEKRIKETIDLLNQGIKSIDLKERK